MQRLAQPGRAIYAVAGRAMIDGFAGPPSPGGAGIGLPVEGSLIRCSARPHRGWSGWPGERGDAMALHEGWNGHWGIVL